jgi:hypothetical protein
MNLKQAREQKKLAQFIKQQAAKPKASKPRLLKTLSHMARSGKKRTRSQGGETSA